MKKPTSKKLTRSKNQKSAKLARITNETVAEHRERILAGGRRFKYPVQSTKRLIVWITISIGCVVLALFLAISWWLLYKVQTTDSFYYRITRTLPLPVAKVDGASVKYGDYLLHYKMSETYLDGAEGADSDDIKAKYDFYRAQAMQKAVAARYAQSIADERGLEVTDRQVDEANKLLAKTSSDQTTISQEVIDRSLAQFYGASSTDVRYIQKQTLLQQTVAYDIDEAAAKVSDEIKQILNKDSSTDFAKIVDKYKASPVDVQMLKSGWVSKNNPDGGLAAAAANLKKGELSGPIKPLSGDGYYFVKLIDSNQKQEVSYQFIKVGLSAFDQQIKRLADEDKISYYIDIPEIQTGVQQQAQQKKQQ